MKPTVLFLFNHSEYALLPWLRNGDFNVVTVDWQRVYTTPEVRVTSVTAR